MTESFFINVSNHPSSKWGDAQLLAAKRIGTVVDIPFPQIDPEQTTEEISSLADEYYSRICNYESATVMVQGEYTFTYALVSRLRRNGITVTTASTRRIVEETVLPDGSVQKSSVFEFCGFRNYA